jgi:hypothetical protein
MKLKNIFQKVIDNVLSRLYKHAPARKGGAFILIFEIVKCERDVLATMH